MALAPQVWGLELELPQPRRAGLARELGADSGANACRPARALSKGTPRPPYRLPKSAPPPLGRRAALPR